MSHSSTSPPDPLASDVRLSCRNVIGRTVSTPANGEDHAVTFDYDLSSPSRQSSSSSLNDCAGDVGSLGRRSISSRSNDVILTDDDVSDDDEESKVRLPDPLSISLILAYLYFDSGLIHVLICQVNNSHEEATPLQREETANPTEDANGTSTKKRKHAPPDFDVMFKKLSDYCEENSHVNVPQNHPELGEWVKELRKKKSRYEMSDSKRPRTKKPRHRSLTEEQIELLNRLGFSWRINATWEERLAQLQSFHAINGHFKVPRIRGNGLGEWLNDQLKLFRQNNLHFMQTKLPRMEDIGYKCK